MTEQQLQKDIFKYFHNKYCLKNHNPRCKIFAVPNGGHRNILEAINLKATGVVSGVSDMIILLPNKCLFIELKTEIGKQSENQKDFENVVNNLGFDYFVIRSLNEFINIIDTYGIKET